MGLEREKRKHWIGDGREDWKTQESGCVLCDVWRARTGAKARERETRVHFILGVHERKTNVWMRFTNYALATPLGATPPSHWLKWT